MNIHTVGTGCILPGPRSAELGRRTTQIQSNNEVGHRGCECLSSRAPFARSLEYNQQAAGFLAGEAGNRRRALTNTLAEILSLSWRFDPGIQLYGRIKSIASISHKMSTNGLAVHQVLDIIGVRAITHHTRDCYRLAGKIHRAFDALGHEYDDYIAVPKPNGYRSIHTTVISPCGFPVEIQIRTQWMHTLSERGPAAHFRYKKNSVVWIPLSHGSLISAGVT